jgi:hypothetical protein
MPWGSPREVVDGEGASRELGGDLTLDLLGLGRHGLAHIGVTREGLEHERVSPRRDAARSSEQQRGRV